MDGKRNVINSIEYNEHFTQTVDLIYCYSFYYKYCVVKINHREIPISFSQQFSLTVFCGTLGIYKNFTKAPREISTLHSCIQHFDWEKNIEKKKLCIYI